MILSCIDVTIGSCAAKYRVDNNEFKKYSSSPQLRYPQLVFFRLTKLFFRNKKFLSKKQLLFSFLCIEKQKKKFGAIRNFLKFFVFQKTLSKGLKGGISIDAYSGPKKCF